MALLIGVPVSIVYTLGQQALNTFSVFYFAELVKSDLWVVWADQYAHFTRFLPRPDQEGIKHSKNKQLRVYCPIIYILYLAVFEYHRDRNWFDKTVHKVWAKLGHPEPDRNKAVLSNL